MNTFTPFHKIKKPHVYAIALLSLITLLPFNSVGAKEADTHALPKVPADAQLLDRIAAIVNEDIILLSDLKARTQQTLAQLKAKGIEVNDLTTLEKKVLDSLILEKLELQKAKQLGIRVTDEELANAIAQIAKKNQLTLEQLQQTLNQESTNGFVQFREQLRKQLLLEKLQQKIALSKAQVTEEEIDNFLQRSQLQQNQWRYHLGHIMLALPESANAKQREKLKQEMEIIRQKLLAGENFSQIAIRFSQGSKALMGGDLGWLDYDQMPTFFAKEATQLKTGEISPIIRSPVGFHIIKLIDKKSKQPHQGSNAREAALQTLRLQKANEVLELWLHQLRASAFIDIKLPELRPQSTAQK
ncbi:peptidylprolyl isomerase [Galenea microaerophila]